jgi:hypothetical protein
LQTNKVFGFVGGIAFLTLTINATTAGPLLRKLGLADISSQREQVILCIRAHWRDQALQDLIGLLTQRRFRRVNFATVRSHVFMLEDLTKNELMGAVDTYHNNNKHLANYRAPKLENILPYIKDEDNDDNVDYSSTIVLVEQHRRSSMAEGSIVANASFRAGLNRKRSSRRIADRETVLSTIELRRIFLDLLKNLYEHQIDQGELLGREFVALSMQGSVDIAADLVARGEPLRDWEFTRLVNLPAGTTFRKITSMGILQPLIKRVMKYPAAHNLKEEGMRIDVERSMAFLHAHATAQQVFQQEFVTSEFSAAEKTVIKESMAECREAEALLATYPAKDVELVVSHKFCNILLNKGARYIEHLNKTGLLKDPETEEIMEEIQEALADLVSCDMTHHPGEISMTDDDDSSCRMEDPLEGIREDEDEDAEQATPSNDEDGGDHGLAN